ncbi:MAG: class I SAM-dependent methyltransferase [Candidatus Rokubacteria bacterium]|nr:class I SAM-dependent methyltransferase [Candidatus Rokubacteria bacterium]
MTLASHAKVIANSLLLRLVPNYRNWKMRRDWDRRARAAPREMTATFDAASWDAYWASGVRDAWIILEALGAAYDPAHTVLESGCGLGRLSEALAERFRSVVGIDVSGEMVRQARALSRRRNVTYLEADGSSLRVAEDASPDVIVAWTVFRHLPRPVMESYVAEAARLLDRGLLVFEVQHRPGARQRAAPDFNTIMEREYDRDALESLRRSNGFRWATTRVLPSAEPDTETWLVVWERTVGSLDIDLQQVGGHPPVVRTP